MSKNKTNTALVPLGENEVLEFIKNKTQNKETIRTHEINQFFREKGATDGQINGIVRRLTVSGRIKRIGHGLYKMNDLTAMEVIRRKGYALAQEVNNLPFSEFNNMSEEEKKELELLSTELKRLFPN